MLSAESFDAKQAFEPREGMCRCQHIPRAGGDAKAQGAWRRGGQEVPAPGTAPTQAPISLLADSAEQKYLLDRRAPLVWVFFLEAGSGVESISLVHIINKALLQGEILPPAPPALGRAGLSAQQLPVPLSALHATQFHTFWFPPAASSGRPPPPAPAVTAQPCCRTAASPHPVNTAWH